MEVFSPPPYREARSIGRPTKLSPEVRLSVAQKVISKEMTYREAAKEYREYLGFFEIRKPNSRWSCNR